MPKTHDELSAAEIAELQLIDELIAFISERRIKAISEKAQEISGIPEYQKNEELNALSEIHMEWAETANHRKKQILMTTKEAVDQALGREKEDMSFLIPPFVRMHS